MRIKLKFLLEKVSEAKNNLNTYLKEELGEHWCGSHFTRVPGIWKCPTSPLETCVYDTYEDSVMDFCLFCGDPLERK